MRLLNSVCKVIADNYSNVPIYIQQTPKNFKRPSFLVTKVTNRDNLKNYNVYSESPNFQIVYFGERNEANQVLADALYDVEAKLREIFLLALAVPVIPNYGETKRRYAKIDTFTSQLRLDEGSIYCNLTLNFTEDIPHIENYKEMGNIDFSIS